MQWPYLVLNKYWIEKVFKTYTIIYRSENVIFIRHCIALHLINTVKCCNICG